MPKLTYIKRVPIEGSTTREIAVEKDGKPFGLIWTYKNTKTCWHPWHVVGCGVEHKTFYKGEKGRDLKAAKAYIESKA